MFFNNKLHVQNSLLAVLMLVFTLNSCVKTEFDQPPVGGDGKDIPTNATIAQLKSLHEVNGAYDLISQDLVIGGTVIMDDRTGNYYKTIVIQDSTGGVEVKFSNGFLYNRYPVGRKIYINCKGLVLTDYNGLIQLVGGVLYENGVPSDIGITENQKRTNITRGFLGAAPEPRLVEPGDFNRNIVSTLIRLEGVQFTPADTAQTWADAPSGSSVNRYLANCCGQEVLVRTSGYSDFAIQKTPSGKGNITGVLSVYGNTYQLYIRDLTDVDMTGARCGGVSGNEVLAPISQVKAAYTGSTACAPGNTKIKGVVISDRAGNNLNNRNVYIQDGTGGIVVRFAASHAFNLGDQIEVVISDQELSEYNKLLQVNNVPLTNAILVASGVQVTPRVATVAEINANYNAWESTLVKISNATLTPAGTFSGSKTMNDGTGSLTLYTYSSAVFSGNTMPTGPVTITGIVSDFNGKQLLIRNLADIQQ